MKNKIVNINNMAIYWRLKDDCSDLHSNIITNKTLKFYYDDKLLLIRQEIDEKLKLTLEYIYKEEFNVGYLQDEHTFSNSYGEDLMSFIEATLSNYRNIKTILEIGCGGCYVLGKLNNVGYEVIGVDPSPIAVKAGKDKKLTVINDFYPTKKYSKKVDCIFHSDVLEHIDTPINFLQEQYEGLNNEGILIISVPDCTESIEIGDVSMALHQHVNYFTINSLKNIVESAGFEVVDIRKAGYGGSLYCSAIKKEKSLLVNKKLDLESNLFFKKAKSNILKFQNIIDNLLLQHKSIGFYMPLRAIPYIFTLTDTIKFRFFDDTKHWYNKYFDGVNTPIENFQDLEQHPVDVIFIMSLTFDHIIIEKINKSSIQHIEIITLRDILDAK